MDEYLDNLFYALHSDEDLVEMGLNSYRDDVIDKMMDPYETRNHDLSRARDFLRNFVGDKTYQVKFSDGTTRLLNEDRIADMHKFYDGIDARILHNQIGSDTNDMFESMGDDYGIGSDVVDVELVAGKNRVGSYYRYCHDIDGLDLSVLQISHKDDSAEKVRTMNATHCFVNSMLVLLNEEHRKLCGELTRKKDRAYVTERLEKESIQIVNVLGMRVNTHVLKCSDIAKLQREHLSNFNIVVVPYEIVNGKPKGGKQLCYPPANKRLDKDRIFRMVLIDGHFMPSLKLDFPVKRKRSTKIENYETSTVIKKLMTGNHLLPLDNAEQVFEEEDEEEEDVKYDRKYFMSDEALYNAMLDGHLNEQEIVENKSQKHSLISEEQRADKDNVKIDLSGRKSERLIVFADYESIIYNDPREQLRVEKFDLIKRLRKEIPDGEKIKERHKWLADRMEETKKELEKACCDLMVLYDELDDEDAKPIKRKLEEIDRAEWCLQRHKQFIEDYQLNSRFLDENEALLRKLCDEMANEKANKIAILEKKIEKMLAKRKKEKTKFNDWLIRKTIEQLRKEKSTPVETERNKHSSFFLGENIPFMLGYSTNQDDEVFIETAKNTPDAAKNEMFTRMLERLVKKYSGRINMTDNDNRTIIYFHNLKYDMELIKRCPYVSITNELSKSGNLYSCDILYRKSGTNYMFKLVDSYKICPMPLSKFQKAFGLDIGKMGFEIYDFFTLEMIKNGMVDYEGLEEGLAKCGLDNASEFAIELVQSGFAYAVKNAKPKKDEESSFSLAYEEIMKDIFREGRTPEEINSLLEGRDAAIDKREKEIEEEKKKTEKKEEEEKEYVKSYDEAFTEDYEYDMIGYYKKYLELDVLTLKGGINKMSDIVSDYPFYINLENILTASSLSSNFMTLEGAFEGSIGVYGNLQNYIMKSVVGGRVCTLNNEKQDIKSDENDPRTYILDFDVTSLYPYGITLCQFPLGEIKPMPRRIFADPKRFMERAAEYDYYFITCKVKIHKKQQIPFFSVIDKNGVREWTNEVNGYHVMDKVTLEDLVNFQKAEILDITVGFMYNEGYSTRFGEIIEELFARRLVAKKEENIALSDIFKLLMNSSYGKLILRLLGIKIIYIRGKEQMDNYLVNNADKVVQYKEIFPYDYKKEEMVEERYRRYEVVISGAIPKNVNMAQHGAQILSQSKRVMHRFMDLANDAVNAYNYACEKNIPESKMTEEQKAGKYAKIYYTDTDSIHIQQGCIKFLAKKFKKKYGFDLVGKKLGQFHNDFGSEKLTKLIRKAGEHQPKLFKSHWDYSKGKRRRRLPVNLDIHSKRFIALGKKCYLDILTTNVEYELKKRGIKDERYIRKDNSKVVDGKYIKKEPEDFDIIENENKQIMYSDDRVDYHIRFKGANAKSIIHECIEQNVSIDEFYEAAYKGEKITLDLTTGKVSMKYIDNRIVNQRSLVKTFKF